MRKNFVPKATINDMNIGKIDIAGPKHLGLPKQGGMMA